MNENFIEKRDNGVLDRFIFEDNLWNYIGFSAGRKLYRRLLRRQTGLFLRGKDAISLEPQLRGLHEPQLTSLISYLSGVGYSDYFIDIGANIGLTSCQSGKNFRVVHMFEPNPLCSNILEVNCVIALGGVNYEIHKFGLGVADGRTFLVVPRQNWGGRSSMMSTTHMTTSY